MQGSGLIGDDSFTMPLTQQELADTMSLSAVHMNRVLRALRAEGLVSTQDRRVMVANFPDLLSLPGFDPIYLHQVRKARQDTERGSQAFSIES